MGKLFDISDDIIQIAQDGLDDIIDQFGKDCLLHYPIRWETDASVVVDPIGNKKDSRWITGNDGEEFYDIDTSGKKAIQETVTLRMLVRWQDKDFWIRPSRNIVLPDGYIQTRGYQSDLPSVMRCEYMLVQSTLKDLIYLKFERDGGPVDPGNIVKDRYFIMNWKRVG